jgi:phospholipase/lecithinase/hemolysin
VGEIKTLAGAGAKQFLIPNLPPLNAIPAVKGMPAAQQALAQFTQVFNSQLASDLPQLQQSLRVQIHMLDINSLFNSVIANPGSYGFTDVVDSALLSGKDGTGYLFWDQYHPTTQTGQVIAIAAGAAVPEPSSAVLLVIALGALAVPLGARRRARVSR